MRIILYGLMMAVLLGLSGCIFAPSCMGPDRGGHGGHGGGGGGSHEMHHE